MLKYAIPLRALLFCSIVLAGEVVSAQGRRSPNLGELSTIELEVRRWRGDLDSELRLSGDGIPGSTLDPAADLGIPAERTWDYRLGLRITNRLRLRGAWFRTKYESEIVLTKDIAIGGLEVPRGAVLESFLELEQVQAGAEFALVRGVYGFISVVGLYERFQARSRFQSEGTTTEPEPLRIELPVFGFKGRVYLTPALAVTAEGLGMKRESEGVVTDVDVMATYNFIPNVAFSYGYRNSYNRVKSVEEVDDRAVFRMRGQYFGVTVRF
ncbi:MAG TPA: hypothetical protein VLK65_31845 [Vicinamibacteria bacterium]|nr:hypothetical protein [Vicinamibacteria bacterium]